MDIAISWRLAMFPFNLYTIGYSGFALDEFVNTLKKYSIGALVDVRSSPYSSYFAQYNMNNIKNVLRKNNMRYIFFGDAFGARPKDLSLYSNNIADFEKMSASSSFIQGCERIKAGLNKLSICLMCAEKDPANCHRAVFITNLLRNLYPEIPISHIHNIAKCEPQEILDQRIMAMHGLEQEHFFLSFDERRQEAYSLQEKAIAMAYNDEEPERD